MPKQVVMLSLSYIVTQKMHNIHFLYIRILFQRNKFTLIHLLPHFKVDPLPLLAEEK